MTLAVALVFLLGEGLEGDFFEQLGDLGELGHRAVTAFGSPGAVALLYIEESGLPLPIPGDVWVVYLGVHTGGDGWKLLAAWLVIIVVVVAGSTNLYLISRRYGHRLVESGFGRLLHLTPERIAQAEQGMRRWGALMVIFGRHIPGFRIPITVVAGSFELPYRIFAPSVAVSTAIWAGVWLALAVRFGPTAIHVLTGHRLVYVVAVLVVALVVGVAAVRIWSRSGRD